MVTQGDLYARFNCEPASVPLREMRGKAGRCVASPDTAQREGTLPSDRYLSARYNITKARYVAAKIQNLFNKDYELAYTYNTPRRGAYVTLGWLQQ